jgi:AbrB family looped-hinge helix DNA binding protein
MQTPDRLPELHLATPTCKGQVTIPAPIRRLLEVGPRDKVSFVVDPDGVQLRRGGSVVEATAGIFANRGVVPTAEELRAATEQAIAGDALERMGG